MKFRYLSFRFSPARNDLEARSISRVRIAIATAISILPFFLFISFMIFTSGPKIDNAASSGFGRFATYDDRTRIAFDATIARWSRIDYRQFSDFSTHFQ